MIDLFLNQKCLHAPRTGTSQHGGQASYGADVERSCRCQNELKVVRGPGGEMTVSDAQIFLAPGITVAVGDRITYQGFAFRVAHVIRAQGLDWEDHVKVLLENGR